MKVSTLLNRKSKWIKYVLATDDEGNDVSYNDPSATKFCLLGALHRAYQGEEFYDKWKLIQNYLSDNNYIPDMVDFNNDDSTTFTKLRKVIRATKI